MSSVGNMIKKKGKRNIEDHTDVEENLAKKKKTADNETSETKSEGGQFFKVIKAFVLPAGIVKARIQIFRNNLHKYGGLFQEKFNPDSTTHIITDEKRKKYRLCKIMKLDGPPKDIKIVKSLWLSKCVKEKKLVSANDFELDCSVFNKIKENFANTTGNDLTSGNADVKTTSENQQPIPSTSTETIETKLDNSDQDKKYPKVGVMFRSYKKAAVGDNDGSDPESDYVASGGELEHDDEEELDLDVSQLPDQSTFLPKGNWVCAQASSQQKVNHNKLITDKFEVLAKAYENTNDKWRAFGYAKAIAALKRHPKEVTTFEEAKALPGVGAKLAEKIWEIIESGDLRKLHEVAERDDVKTLDLFMGVWGAGAVTARTWVQQGFRTLEDLRTKANLTRHQKIGLQHYDDLNDRMPRSEAAVIEKMVKDAAESVQPGVIAMACGSYRRGKATCGDVDVLITHPDGKSHKGMYSKLLTKLHGTGFLTDDLVSQEANGKQQKYLGVCKLPGENTKYRRLDIIVVPYDEYACAVMYFTGSAHFNRSMRLLAIKKGMSLSEHSLNTGVTRNSVREKLNKGTPLPTPTEESVFKQLGIPYRSPEERNH